MVRGNHAVACTTGDLLTAPLPNWPFDAHVGDHFETSLAAYEDIVRLLQFAARAKARRHGRPAVGAEAKLRIYDPYFCSGRMPKLLRELGFPRVINRCRDFYRDAAEDALPRFDVLLTNPPYSGDHKERLFDFIVERQRRAGTLGYPEPFFVLLPSWTVGKVFYRKFINKLAKLNNSNASSLEVARAVDDGSQVNDDMSAHIFYVCRRGPRGRPVKYSFDHLPGAGLPQCPFFGVWVCGGFGSAQSTMRAARRAARSIAEGFWESDGAWYLCRPAFAALPSGGTPPKAAVGFLEVDWTDGSRSAIPQHHLSNGLCVFSSSVALEMAGLLRTAEDERRRRELNPSQRARHEIARAALLEHRRAARESCGWKRKRRPDRREYVRDDNAASAICKTQGEEEQGKKDGVGQAGPLPPRVCRHFFSIKGCSRGEKCRFVHKIPC